MEQIFHKLFKNLYFYYLLYYNSWKLIFQIHSLKRKPIPRITISLHKKIHISSISY